MLAVGWKYRISESATVVLGPAGSGRNSPRTLPGRSPRPGRERSPSSRAPRAAVSQTRMRSVLVSPWPRSVCLMVRARSWRYPSPSWNVEGPLCDIPFYSTYPRWRGVCGEVHDVQGFRSGSPPLPRGLPLVHLHNSGKLRFIPIPAGSAPFLWVCPASRTARVSFRGCLS